LECVFNDLKKNGNSVSAYSVGICLAEMIKVLTGFDAIMQCYQNNEAVSLRDVSRMLQLRDLDETLPPGISPSPSSVLRIKRDASEFFIEHFGFDTDAKLFFSPGVGQASKPTELGEIAWRLSRDLLASLPHSDFN